MQKNQINTLATSNIIRKGLVFISFFFIYLTNYSQTSNCINYNEEVVIFTDRLEYIAGENIWFKAFVLNDRKINTEKFSKIVYVEIINSEGFSLSRKKIRLEKGLGKGDLQLPDTLTSGVYKIIAYTNILKNNPYDFFQSNIIVYNPLKPFNDVKVNDKYNVAEMSFDGNELVAGVLNTLYIKFNENRDKIYKGQIVNLNDSIIKQFNFKNACSSLEFVPTINEQYFLKLINIDTISYKLPTPKAKGCVFKLNKVDIDSIEILLELTEEFMRDNRAILYKIDSSDMKIAKLHKGKEKLRFAVEKLNFNKKNNITFYDLNGDILWERQFYIKPKYVNVEINTPDSHKLDTRSNSSLYLSINDSCNDQDIVSIAVSIRKTHESEDVINQGNFRDDLLNVEKRNFELIFDTTQTEINTNNKLNKPEFDGALLNGKINNKEGNPLSNKRVILSIPDSIIKIKITETDSNGRFHFFINPLQTKENVVINANDSVKNYNILIDNNFLNNYTFFRNQKDDFYFNEKTLEHLNKLYINYRINKIFELKNEINDTIINRFKSVSFYQQPDKIYYFDSYIELDSIHEYFYEVILDVKIVKRKKLPRFRILNKNSGFPFNNDPAMFIDGVYINDPKFILGLNPKNCSRIEIIQQPVMLKGKVYDGLLAVFTENYDLKNVNLPFNTLHFEYNVFDEPKKFDLSFNQNRQIPIFQNILYWNPDVEMRKKLIKEINFYTGDDNSWYYIEVFGISKDGKVLYGKKMIKVGDA